MAILLCCAVITIESCSKKDDPAIPLLANAGPDGNGEVDQVYTLDGSASTGPVGFTYQWTYGGVSYGNITEDKIAFQGKDQAKPTFTPPMNGSYFFHLLIKSPASVVSEDDVVITVSSVLTIGGTLTNSLTLKNIEPDPNKPDYRVTSDLIIPAGMSLTANESSYGITIEVVEPAGIEIQGTATFGGVTFTSTTGWKGILIKGNVQFNGSQGFIQIQKAGKGTFTGQTESAAVTVLNGTLTMNGVQFTSSTGYDLLLPTFGSHTVTSVLFSAAIPIKSDIRNAPIFVNNNLGQNYTYVALTTPGAGTTLGGVAFPSNVKYLIDGDYTAGSLVTFSGGTVTIKDGAGILASEINTANTIFQSQTSAGWKGLAVTGFASGSSIFNTQFINAGSALFNTGSFQSTAKAAIFYTGSAGLSIQGCQIKDSQGYGFYDASLSYGSIKSTTFSNSALAAIYTTQSEVASTLTATNTNTFQMNSGIASVELGAPIGSLISNTWPSLGTGNYYSVTSNILVNGSSTLTLAAGASLKFKSGKYIYASGGKLIAIGTSLSPIVFDSEAGTSGSWPGIFIETDGLYNLEYCQIKNGGSGFISTATEKGNVVIKYSGFSTANTFKNNTVSGSGGYGVVLELGAKDPGIADVSNVYSSNTQGNTIKK